MVSSDEITRKLNEKRNGIDPDKSICPNCGTRNPPGSSFCLECGRTLITSGGTPSTGPIDVKKQAPEKKPGGPSPLRKVPGFRSGTGWKMVLGSIGYLVALIIIVAIVATAFVNHIPTFEVAGAPITVMTNNSSENGNTSSINATIRDTGSTINVLPVQVYAGGKHVGDFFLTNVTSNQDIWFQMEMTDNLITVKTSQNGSTNFYVQGDNSSSSSSSSSASYSLNPGDYKLVIGNASTTLNDSVVTDVLEPMVNNYNKTKGSQSDSIKVQGQVAGDYEPSGMSAPSLFPLNTNLTIVMKMNSGHTAQGQWVFDNGVEGTGYQSYLDVVVIYWPEMKIAGWHRIYGPAISDEVYQVPGDIYGDDVSNSDVEKWIQSLPQA